MCSAQRTLATRNSALRYHDPQLVALADQYNVNTELWALPWLFTIFASGIPIAIVLHIWDLLLLSSENAAPLYFACAVVISQRSCVLQCDPDALPLVMRNCLQKACDSCASVNDVWSLAESLMLSTPQSFKAALHKVTLAPSVPFSPSLLILLPPPSLGLDVDISHSSCQHTLAVTSCSILTFSA